MADRRCRRAARDQSPRPPRSAPAGRAPRGCADRRRRRVPFSASTDIAPARMAAAKSRSALKSAVEREGGGDLGAVDQRQPFLRRRAPAARAPAASAPSAAGIAVRRHAASRPRRSAARRDGRAARDRRKRRPSPATGRPAAHRLREARAAARRSAAARPNSRGRAPIAFSARISRTTCGGSGSPRPQAWDRMRLRCRSSSRSAAIRVWASRPKPVLTP